MKGGIAMKESDFLKILESFPGKEEFKKGVPVPDDFVDYDYVGIGKELKENPLNLNPGTDEDLWLRILMFMECQFLAVSEFGTVEMDELALDETDILSAEAQELSKEIGTRFRQWSEDVGSYTASGIMMDELYSFIKAEQSFFD